MADAVLNERDGDNNEKQNSEKKPSLETETLSENSQSQSPDEPKSDVSHVSPTIQKKDIKDPVPVSDKPEDKLITDKGGIMRNPQRKSRSACRARSRDPKKCHMNFREMIGKHEIRNEELEQLEGDLRERLDMLECSMPAVMVWNILRTAQGAPPSVVRRLMEKQFQGVHSAGNIAIPSTPSQHYDHRVREIEAERKEAVRRAEEARALLTDKEAAIEERRKRLEEAKKCNQEKKERVERLNREAVEVREAIKNARGDDTSRRTGECGAIRCKEKLLGDIGSLSSIGSTDLECFARLQELAESEVCMKQQICELERREEVYMRTLQQADELWSKMEENTSGDVRELQEQLNVKTAANQQLADRVCQLEDEQERLKKRLITCNDELAKFTEKVHTNAETGSKYDIATVADHGIEARAKTITTSTSASPQTFDVDSTALPQTKDKELTFAPKSEEKGINVSTKTFDKDSEAVVDLIDREVDRPIGLGVDTGVGDEALDDTSQHRSGRSTKISPEEQKKIPEPLENSQWDDGYPADTIPKDMVESSTGTDNVVLQKRVSTTEMPVQATVKMVEQPVGGSGTEDVAEIIDEIKAPQKSHPDQDTDLLSMIKAPEGEKKTPQITQQYDSPVSEKKRVTEPPKAIEDVSKTITDEKKSEFDKSIEVINEPVTDELRFKKPTEPRDKDVKTITDRKKTDTHKTTEESDDSASKKKSVSELQATGGKDSDAIIDKMKHKVHELAQKIERPNSEKRRRSERQTTIDKDSDATNDQMKHNAQEQRQDSEKKGLSKRQATINSDSDAVSDQMERNTQVEEQDSDKTVVSKRQKSTMKDSDPINDQLENEVPEVKQKTDQLDPVEKSINKPPATAEKDSEKVIVEKEPRVQGTKQETDRSTAGEKDDSKLPIRVSKDRKAGIDQTEHGIIEIAKEPDEPIPTEKKVSKRPTKREEDNKNDSTMHGRGNRVSDEKSVQSDSEAKDSPLIRTKKVSNTNEIMPDEKDNDSDENAQRTNIVKKHVKPVIEYPRSAEKKERKIHSSKHKARYSNDVETDDDEDIPEAWKNWDWNKGCPPDGGCNISNRPTRVGDKPPKDVSTLESQIQATVEMRERSVGGRGSEDIAELNRADEPTKDKIGRDTDLSLKIQATNTADPTGEKTDEILLSREELRNWYNTVNSIHHTISLCPNCQIQVDATAQLMRKINDHLWMMALADKEFPITDEDMRKSLIHMAKRSIEEVRDLEPEVREPKKSQLSSVSKIDTELISTENLNNFVPDTSQLVEEDPMFSSEKEETMDNPIARSITLSGEEYHIAKPTNTLGTLPGAEPSLQPSLQVPVEDELSMPLAKEREPLSQEKPLPIIDPEDEQRKSVLPSTVKKAEILESEKEQAKPKEPPGKIVGAGERIEKEKTKSNDVDKFSLPKPETCLSKFDKKLQPLGTLEECICSPQICRPVVTCIPEPYTEGTQTSPQMPRTLHRLKLKTKTESPRRPPDNVIMWHRPMIWPRRREDKSTLTTAGVGTQADSTLRRERITHQKIDRKDDCTCSGLIPRKIEFGGPNEHTSRSHPDERVPTPVSHAVAEPSNSLRLQPSSVSNEHEIAVTQYTGKSLTPTNSDLCCVDCGRPITPELAHVSSKASIRTGTKSQKGHTLKKLTTSSSSIEQKNNLCCDCKVLHEATKADTTADSKSEDKKASTYDEQFCCPCPSDVKNKKAIELKKPSKKKRKPEKKDQSVTANIPRSKQKKISKNKKGIDDSSVFSKAESQTTHSPSILSKSINSENSVTESCNEKSCIKMTPEIEESVKPLAPKVSSFCALSSCGCNDNSSVQVPHTNYSAIFKTNINKNDCECASSNESNTQK